MDAPKEIVLKRVTVPALDEILGNKVNVLDHGFVRLIDYMGDDSSIVQAARISYGEGTKTPSSDQGLINYLMRNRHTSVFEMCEIKLHVKMPIFVARQWIRHRTANVNEYSGRYSILNKEYYIPDRISLQSTMNKQGREGEIEDPEEQDEIREMLKLDSVRSYEHYTKMLDKGVAREIARMDLSLNYYTEMYWKIDLHNLLHFLSLRVEQHAQYEIRVYAEVILDIVKKWTPFTYEAFMNYRINGYNLSEKGMIVLKRMLKGEKVPQEESNMSKREYEELMSKLV